MLSRSLLHTLREPYVDTALAKGAGRTRVHLRHALRNAALPALTVTGLVVGGLLSGAVVTETVFSRAGLGRLTATSVAAQDIPVVQGVVLVAATVYVLVNLLIDVIYPLLDPRIVTGAPPPRHAVGPEHAPGGADPRPSASPSPPEVPDEQPRRPDRRRARPAAAHRGVRAHRARPEHPRGQVRRDVGRPVRRRRRSSARTTSTHRGPWRTRLEDLVRKPGLILALVWSARRSSSPRSRRRCWPRATR